MARKRPNVSERDASIGMNIFLGIPVEKVFQNFTPIFIRQHNHGLCSAITRN